MKISEIKNIKQLSNFLRCDDLFLTAFLEGDFKILDYQNFVLPTTTGYTSIIQKFYLKKRNKYPRSYREVYSVLTDTLKSTLKGLSTFLKESYTPSTAVHGYVYGRNIRTNAEVHLSKSLLLSVDINNFFDTINGDMVSEALLFMGFSSFSVERLCKLVTLDNSLPPGYCTSPIISNIVTRNLDEELLTLCGKDCIYTRYADDLYFSSNISLPTLENITEIISKYGFALNPDKTKYMPRGVKQYVTGLTVFDKVRPRITKKIKRNLRLELHYLSIYGLRGHVLKKMGKTFFDYGCDEFVRQEVDKEVESTDRRITGWLRFINSVESSVAQKFMTQYDKVVL